MVALILGIYTFCEDLPWWPLSTAYRVTLGRMEVTFTPIAPGPHPQNIRSDPDPDPSPRGGTIM